MDKLQQDCQDFIVYCATEHIKRISEDKPKKQTTDVVVKTPEQLLQKLVDFYDRHQPPEVSSSSGSNGNVHNRECAPSSGSGSDHQDK